MNYFLFWFLVGVIVGVVIALVYWWVCYAWKGQKRNSQGSLDADDDKAIDGNHLQQILALFKKHETLTNEIVREELGFGRRFVVRAMDELQKQNKVEQVGVTGVAVYYRLKK